MDEREKRGLQQLSLYSRLMVVGYWHCLLIKQTYLKQSVSMRIIPLHAIFMLVVLASFPDEYPPLVIAPVLFAASYYVCLLLLFLLPKYPKQKEG